MARRQPTFTEEEKIAVENAMNVKRTKSKFRRLMMLKLKMQGKNSNEIGGILGVHPETVNRCVSQFKNNVITAICPKKETSNRRLLTDEQEAEFLEPLKKKAEAGQILEVSKIGRELEKFIGKKIAKSTVYLLLHRHGWRKVMPRSKHPKKATKEEIDSYIKNNKKD